jgi:hypothetical protein
MFLPPGQHLAVTSIIFLIFPVINFIFPTGSTHSIRCILWGSLPSLPAQVISDSAYAESQVTLEQPEDEYSLSLFSYAMDKKY